MLDTVAMPNVADISSVQARTRPNDIAFWCDGEVTTFSQLNEFANRAANGLKSLGVEAGMRVGYLAKNSSVHSELMYGCAKIRAVLTPLNTRLAVTEIRKIIDDAELSVLFVDEAWLAVVDELISEISCLRHILCIDPMSAVWPHYQYWRDQQDVTPPLDRPLPDDEVIQLYTSGTTGAPKGVMLTNANYRSVMRQASQLEWGDYAAGEALLNAMPLFHVAGINATMLATAQGAKTVVLASANPSSILDVIEEHSINHAIFVPALIYMLSREPDFRERDYSSLKQILYGASSISLELLKFAMEVTGAKFTQLYGLTETTGGGAYLPPEAHYPASDKLHSCGIPFPDTEILCVDEKGNSLPIGEVGEIVIKSDIVMKGYWNQPEASDEAVRNGYLHTGDAGYFDRDGYLYIHDRIKDMIISGGENIYPAEVEAVMIAHPEIADVAVIGSPDKKWGETVLAVLVPEAGRALDADRITSWVRERLAGYKCPRKIEIVDELPRNPSGKILRNQLRKQFTSSSPSPLTENAN